MAESSPAAGSWTVRPDIDAVLRMVRTGAVRDSGPDRVGALAVRRSAVIHVRRWLGEVHLPERHPEAQASLAHPGAEAVPDRQRAHRSPATGEADMGGRGAQLCGGSRTRAVAPRPRKLHA